MSQAKPDPYVKTVQRKLNDAGFAAGEVDGWAGSKTYGAILRFQAARGLARTGVMDRTTHAALFGRPQPKSANERAPGGIDRDLDPPEAVPCGDVAARWPRQSQVRAHFGEPGANQVLLGLPWPMRLAWDKGTTIRRFSCHEAIADPLLRVLERVGDAYAPADIERHGFDLFGGCLNVRPMRGGSRLSMHAWGIALDIDPERNRLRWTKGRAYLAKPECDTFRRLFREEGFVSLGEVRDFDWMHFQAARL